MNNDFPYFQASDWVFEEARPSCNGNLSLWPGQSVTVAEWAERSGQPPFFSKLQYLDSHNLVADSSSKSKNFSA